MPAVLSWFMAGDTPERRESPAPGYATFDHLLTAIGQQTGSFQAAIADLKDTLRAENAATRSLVETYRAESNRRLDALEEWRELQEDQELVRQGKAAVTLGIVRLLAKHWQLVWAVVALFVTVIFTMGGGPSVSVGPSQ